MDAGEPALAQRARGGAVGICLGGAGAAVVSGNAVIGQLPECGNEGCTVLVQCESVEGIVDVAEDFCIYKGEGASRFTPTLVSWRCSEFIALM